MKIEKIDLNHKELLQTKFKKLNTELSDYSFAFLYLYRNQNQYRIVFMQDHVYVMGITNDHQRFLMLCDSPSDLDREEVIDLLRECDCLFPVPEQWKSYFEPNLFHVSYQEADSDYCFSVEKLAYYLGLSSKRNLERQFIDHHDVDKKILTEECFKDAHCVLDLWQEASGLKREDTDYEACFEAISYLNILELTGRVVYADHQPVGFLIGEALSQDTFVIHFAKADTRYKGVYAYLFQTFAEENLGQYRYFNLEEDMGLANLKRAKKEYHPLFYRVKLRVVHSPSKSSSTS